MFLECLNPEISKKSSKKIDKDFNEAKVVGAKFPILVVASIAAVFGLAVLDLSPALAQESPPQATTTAEQTQEKQVEEDTGGPKTLEPGVIATTGSYRSGTAIDSTDTSAAAPGDEGLPISAGVKESNGRCAVTVSNTSEEDGYSVSFAVEGSDTSGRRVLRKSYSARLQPKKSVTKEFACRKGLNLAVLLKSGSKI
ncbi:hypothetical protein BVY02_01140 [bacterium J17]|nr:hypothetical protein BVY02_01140 [bacterium J17]